MEFVAWMFVIAAIGFVVILWILGGKPTGQESKSDDLLAKIGLVLFIIVVLSLLIAFLSGSLDIYGGCPSGGYYDIC